MAVPLPSVESLAHRARIAALVAQLRPTHFRTHLTKLPAHRIPTLWTLYRGILRDAPTDTIRSHMRASFRERMRMRAQGDITRELRRAHKWWDVFKKARSGDPHFQAVCERYSRMLEHARRQQLADKVYEEEMAWYERMRTRPIMTGGYLRPTLFNGPLPRLVPQPLHITGMITARRAARERRLERYEAFSENLRLIHAECKFEDMLYRKATAAGKPFNCVFIDDPGAWRRPIQQLLDGMSDSFDREKKRLALPYPPEMLAEIKEARREKVRNKTREREREARGERTARLSRALRQRPPPHVLCRMDVRARRLDAVARGASEVGYVAQAKMALGYRLRDPEAWKVELGAPEEQERLDREAKEIDEENARRRAAAAQDEDVSVSAL